MMASSQRTLEHSPVDDARWLAAFNGFDAFRLEKKLLSEIMWLPIYCCLNTDKVLIIIVIKYCELEWSAINCNFHAIIKDRIRRTLLVNVMQRYGRILKWHLES